MRQTHENSFIFGPNFSFFSKTENKKNVSKLSKKLQKQKFCPINLTNNIKNHNLGSLIYSHHQNNLH